MAFKKGMAKVPGSGRKPGVKNKTATWLAKEMEKITSGEPVPILMLRVGIKCLKEGRTKEAISAIGEACQYAYPRLKAVEVSGGLDSKSPQLVISLATEPQQPPATGKQEHG
jgi:hypothetical protein